MSYPTKRPSQERAVKASRTQQGSDGSAPQASKVRMEKGRLQKTRCVWCNRESGGYNQVYWETKGLDLLHHGRRQKVLYQAGRMIRTNGDEEGGTEWYTNERGGRGIYFFMKQQSRKGARGAPNDM